MWSVYLLRTRTGTLYTGIALDVERRLAEHRAGTGAKYLRGKGPLELVFERTIGERGEALRVEAMLKRLPKSEKEQIAREGVSAEDLTARLAPREGGDGGGMEPWNVSCPSGGRSRCHRRAARLPSGRE